MLGLTENKSLSELTPIMQCIAYYRLGIEPTTIYGMQCYAYGAKINNNSNSHAQLFPGGDKRTSIDFSSCGLMNSTSQK